MISSMKSSLSSTSSSPGPDSPVSSLFKTKKNKTLSGLENFGFSTIEDLLWVLPKKIFLLPETLPFNKMKPGEYFRGEARVLNVSKRPLFYRKGRSRAMMYHVDVSVADKHSDAVFNLKWFNCYQSVVKKLESLKVITFLGKVSDYQGNPQITNPEYEELNSDKGQNSTSFSITYPALGELTSTKIKSLFDKLPTEIFDAIEETLPQEVIQKNHLIPKGEAFKIAHGLIDSSRWTPELWEKAIERLAYEDFLEEQLKLSVRRENHKKPKSPVIDEYQLQEIVSRFPFELTSDQMNALTDSVGDLKRGHPMMRLIQGDVGSGKTAVATALAVMVAKAGFQSCFMCPTESLARQQFEWVKNIFKDQISIELLTGGLGPKEKRESQARISEGKANLIFGTHALFQEAVSYKNLALTVIDEQHKFGVEQRLSFSKKNPGVHTLIMTATPIPRSLSLTQYGDLDVTLIKNMPKGRKGHQSRIVKPENFPQFLNFVKTRMDMGEQAFIVVPAIEESETLDIHNLEEVYDRFQKLYPDISIGKLHGKLSSEEKQNTLNEFRNKQLKILITTTVIEVGIDIPNTTILAVLNPERFGLSSLHQLRGRVGRGEKPGFFFLIVDKELSEESLERLEVIEKFDDGFKIAEEDLRLRGEGALFGKEQSGANRRRVASIITHASILYQVKADIPIITERPSNPIKKKLEQYQKSEEVFSTV